MANRAPSTAWREVVAADEAERFAGYAASFVEIQRARTAKLGKGRAVHRKQHLGLLARVDIEGDVPLHARHGLFARAGTYDAWVRLSNGGADSLDDKAPDVRGFAFKVLAVTGPGALGASTESQDFALINRVSFGFPNSAAFVGLVLEASKSPVAAARHLVKKHGFFGGVRELARLQKSFAQKFTGFATEHFHSAAPIACGPYAVRVRIRPHAAANDAKQPKVLAHELARRLLAGPVTYDIQLQFFVDEAITPIEDASTEWPESEAPYLTVGRLTILAQDVDSAEGKVHAARVEAAKFDPWCALAEHRPLGDVMRARKVVYFASQTERGAV